MSYDNSRYGRRGEIRECINDLDDFIRHCAHDDLKSEARHVIDLVRFSEISPETADQALCFLYAEDDERQL